ncbi:DNA polymerase/3'-5' exonuclease PolX [Candidatus Acidulodesulfobacterium sp. H_13]|uniref:DNA polymerase/3'-5' exonuclease PolX n=1 Tax=Candidatus Acidulodesulfobacterium sp. H_13 TaxID=3395470 RepID=UPI003AF747E0
MTNIEIAGIFEKIADILEIKNENPFKIRAYLNASGIISRMSENLTDIIGGGQTDIQGIGKDLFSKIKEIVNTGHLAYYDELADSIPSGILELVRLHGLGPRKANFLYENLNIKSIDNLRNAIDAGKLYNVRGFGEKTIENLRKSIEEYMVFRQRFLYPVAAEQALLLEAYLQNTDIKGDIAIAGSLRRKTETIGDINIVVAVKDKNKKKFKEWFLNYGEILRVEFVGETRISLVLKSGINVSLHIVSDDNFVCALQHFTGSKLHNEELRMTVRKCGYDINEHGIFTNKETAGGKDRIRVNNESEFYGLFAMQYIPPELREGVGEITAALNRDIPDMVEEKDLKGVFHIHTTYTDGKDSLEVIVEACIREGYSYAGISDHSVSAYYANGLSASELESQIEYIDRLNKKYKGRVKIFKGIESDILSDGSLDYNDKTLSMLDFVIASVHSKFNMSESMMTERIIKAIKNPYTTMIGHLTGRLLLERNGYPINVSKILDYASEYKTIIELNARPKRLDIDWRYIKEAIGKGVLLSINPDAHDASSVNLVNYGINTARKGWAEKTDILNTRDASVVANILTSIRDHKKKLK